MNPNLDRKSVKLFNRLARKHKSVIKKIRKFWWEDVRDNYMYSNEVTEKEANLLANHFMKKQSDKAVLEYWEDFYDSDIEILPKVALKNLTEKEKELLDIE